MLFYKSRPAALVAIALLLFGCTALQPTDMQESVCVKRPAEFIDTPSHICDVSWQLQIPPEDTDNLLLDASAMAYVVADVDKQTIGNFLTDMEIYLGPICNNRNFDDVLEKITDDAEKSLLLARVLNRRLRFYATAEPIGLFDCWMIHKAIGHQREQFGLPTQRE